MVMDSADLPFCRWSDGKLPPSMCHTARTRGGVVSRDKATDGKVRGSNAGRGKRFCSSSKRPAMGPAHPHNQ